MENKKRMYIDAETNALWGEAFALAGIITEDRKVVDTFLARCPIEGNINPWVAENVIPKMTGIEETHGDYSAMLKAFAEWYLPYRKNNVDVIVHMGVPVEAKVFLDLHEKGLIGDRDAPYPLIDISAIPEIKDSVDSYNEAHGTMPDSALSGGTHNPLYDCFACASAYEHWLVNYKRKGE